MSVSIAPSVLILTVPLAGSGSSGFIEMFTPSVVGENVFVVSHGYERGNVGFVINGGKYDT
jgi:hypothetical protein